MKALTLYTARSAGLGDCTAGGITATHDQLSLIGTVTDDQGTVTLLNDPTIPDARPGNPFVALEVTVVGQPTIHLVPVELDADGWWRRSPGWHMAGGNYAASSDARVGRAIEAATDGLRFYGAISVHDRREDY